MNKQLMDYFLIKKVEELRPYPLNIQLFDGLVKNDYEALKNDIQEYGIKTELHVLSNGMVLCGHQRLKIAKELGLKTVPVKFINIDPNNEEEIKQYTIIDNLLRRHLSTEQKYRLINELHNSFEPIQKGGDRKSIEFKSAFVADSISDEINQKISVKLNIPKRTVERAIQYSKVIKDKPELKSEKVNIAIKKYVKEKKQQAIKAEAQKIEEKPTKDLNFIIHGDCLEKLHELETNSIDCVITDPPYGIEIHNTRNGSKDFDDGFKYIEELLNKVCLELQRVCKDNAHLYFFTGCFVENLNLFYIILKNYFIVQDWPLIWKTNNHTICDYNQNYPRKHENILFCKMPKGKDRPLDKCIPSVLEFDKVKNGYHITEKPVKLLEVFIKNSTQENELILDPFAGSGSLGESAIKNNRRCLLIEKEKEFVDIMKVRLEKLL